MLFKGAVRSILKIQYYLLKWVVKYILNTCLKFGLLNLMLSHRNRPHLRASTSSCTAAIKKTPRNPRKCEGVCDVIYFTAASGSIE